MSRRGLRASGNTPATRGAAKGWHARIPLLILTLAIVLGVSEALLLGWGTLIEPRLAVAQVRLQDGSTRKISSRDFLYRLEFERAREVDAHGAGTNYREISSLGFAASVLERMTREILLREEADKRGLAASAVEIHSLRPGVRSAFLRQILGAQILETKFKQLLSEQFPARQDQVRLKLIRFLVPSEAAKARPILASRAEFEAFYEQALAGRDPNAAGYLHDWSSAPELRRELSAAFSKRVFQLRGDERSLEPIPVADQWYLVQCEGHEVRLVPELQRKARAQDAYEEWLREQNRRVMQFPHWMALVLPMDQARAQMADAMPPPAYRAPSGSASAPTALTQPNLARVPSASASMGRSDGAAQSPGSAEPRPMWGQTSSAWRAFGDESGPRAFGEMAAPPSLATAFGEPTLRSSTPLPPGVPEQAAAAPLSINGPSQPPAALSSFGHPGAQPPDPLPQRE